MNTTVLVSNLAPGVSASTLEDMFSIVGNVQKAVVELDATSGVSRCFGFVEMSTPSEAKDCVLHFNGQKNEGLTLMVREKQPLGEKQIVFNPKGRSALLKAVRATNRKLKGSRK